MAQATRIQGKHPEEMRKGVGHAITFAVAALPAVALVAIGFAIGNGYTAIGLACIWFGIFAAMAVRFPRKATFLVVERFGYLWDVKFAGVRIVIPGIDTPVKRDDFLQKETRLFASDDPTKPIEIDFKGGSAPIDASGWYQVGNPEDIESGNFDDPRQPDDVRRQVLRYTYRVKDEELDGRVAKIFQGAFREFLESGKTIPEAQDEMEHLAEEGTKAAAPALAEMGTYPFPNKGIVVRDLDLPAELIELRQRETRGQADAQEMVNRSRSYWEPMKLMKEGLNQAGLTLTDEQIFDLFMKQKAFETLQSTGANISLVASDVDSVVKTITIGSVNTGKGGQP